MVKITFAALMSLIVSLSLNANYNDDSVDSGEAVEVSMHCYEQISTLLKRDVSIKAVYAKRIAQKNGVIIKHYFFSTLAERGTLAGARLIDFNYKITRTVTPALAGLVGVPSDVRYSCDPLPATIINKIARKILFKIKRSAS